MLQQTRVDVARDYYRRWLRAFPTARALARAPYRRVLKLWEGLGYYARARNLHRAAPLIGGVFQDRSPDKFAGLLALPGIGRYTAGAIASIAFEERRPAVDGNVARVLARVFDLCADVTRPVTQRNFGTLAAALLPRRGCGEFNQALMELGALICTPTSPRCPVCPLRGACRARALQTVGRLPNRGPRPAAQSVLRTVAFVRRDGRVLVRRRPAAGLLAGLWELPPLDRRQFRARAEVLTLRHTITNRRIRLRVVACDPRGAFPAEGRWRWITTRGLKRLAFSAAHRRALERLLSAQH